MLLLLYSRKRSSSARGSSSWLDRLQRDAQQSELDFTNTPTTTFLFLSLIQVPVALVVSFVVSPATANEWYLNRFSYMALANIGCHWAGFAFSMAIGSVKYFDIIEDCTYFANIWWMLTTLRDPSPRQTLAHVLGLVWCVRICAFVGYRVMVRGSDFRFDKLNRAWGYQLFGWTSGGTWCWANGFALWYVADAPQGQAPLGLSDWLGLAIFVFGLVFEFVADIQKYRFNARHGSGKNDHWIASGLWSLCRHPNYFGENVLWLGVAIICMSGDFGSVHGVALCLVTPLWSFVFLLFTSLMLLEKRADQRWGTRKDYLAYRAATPVWLPKLPKLPKLR